MGIIVTGTMNRLNCIIAIVFVISVISGITYILIANSHTEKYYLTENDEVARIYCDPKMLNATKCTFLDASITVVDDIILIDGILIYNILPHAKIFTMSTKIDTKFIQQTPWVTSKQLQTYTIPETGLFYISDKVAMMFYKETLRYFKYINSSQGIKIYQASPIFSHINLGKVTQPLGYINVGKEYFMLLGMKTWIAIYELPVNNIFKQ